jgi:hypothetical protein
MWSRLKFTLVFPLLGVLLLGYAVRQQSFWPGFLSASAGVAFAALGAAYAFGWPGLLGKTRKGRLLSSSYLLFWPYHLLSYGSLLWFRLLRVAPFQEVLPGLYLGGRLLPWEAKQLQAAGISSVLDLTCELSEVGFLRRVPAYFCIPLLDGTAPNREALAIGVRFIRERLLHGPVYVHCAMGHGRAPTFVAGFLLASGKATSVAEAVEFLRQRRPGVRLRSAQQQALQHLLP